MGNLNKGSIVHYKDGWQCVTAIFPKKGTCNIGPIWGGRGKFSGIKKGIPLDEVYEDSEKFYQAWEQSEQYRCCKIMNQKYIIEARDSNGNLLLGDYPQPESIFGMGAIHGIDDWSMSRILFDKLGTNISLHGTDIPNWPKLVDPQWVARKKTWA